MHGATHSAEGITEDQPWPAPRLAWYALALLSLAYVLSYLDRILINLLIEPIQAQFQINDTQFGLLQSLAFGIFYTLMALPLGRLADSRDRRMIVAGGIALFSLFTAISGLARSYGQLFVARIGVGVGEASLTPSAYSLLSDYFPPERLGRAIGLFTMSAFVGTGLAYIGGGAVVEWLSGLGQLKLPVLGLLEPWQFTFLLIGIPGLLLAPLMLTMREPPRRGVKEVKPVPLSEVVNELRSRKRTLMFIFAGFATVTFSSYASAVWTPAFFLRTYGWQPGEIGLWYGLIYLTFGTTGAIFGGWLSDRLMARGVLDAPLRVAAFGYLGTCVFGGLAPLMPSPELALILFAPATFLGTLPFPLAGTAIQLITPGHLRGQVSALYLTVINIVGLGLGPVVVGAFTDYLFTDPGDVRYSLAIVNAAAAPVAAVLLGASFAGYRALRAASAARVSGAAT